MTDDSTRARRYGDLRTTGTRTSAAWTLVAAGSLVILLMLVFILQNSQRAPMHFLWLHGSPPLGASLLLAAVIGALIVLCLGAGRILQLRLAARRHRHFDAERAPDGRPSGAPPSNAPPSNVPPSDADPPFDDRQPV